MRYFKQSIRITPNKNFAAAPIFKGKSTIEFEGKRVLMVMRNRNELYDKNEFKDGMPCFVHSFDGVTPLMIDFKWELDPITNKYVDASRQKKQQDVVNFLKFHENIVWRKDIDSLGNVVRNPGNKNLKKPLFIIEILEDTINNEISRWEKELKVRVIVDRMTEEQRCELCHFYGLDPTKMIDGETKISLAGKSGIAVSQDNIDDFIALMENPQNMIHGVLNKVLLNKALVDGVIKKEGNVYVSDGGVQMGFTDAEAMNYIESNNGFKEMLCKRLNQNRVTFLEKVRQETVGNIEAEFDILNQSVDAKKAWAKENKVPNAGVMHNEETLNRAIKDFIIARGMKAHNAKV